MPTAERPARSPRSRAGGRRWARPRHSTRDRSVAPPRVTNRSAPPSRSARGPRSLGYVSATLPRFDARPPPITAVTGGIGPPPINGPAEEQEVGRFRHAPADGNRGAAGTALHGSHGSPGSPVAAARGAGSRRATDPGSDRPRLHPRSTTDVEDGDADGESERINLDELRAAPRRAGQGRRHRDRASAGTVAGRAGPKVLPSRSPDTTSLTAGRGAHLIIGG